MASTNHFTDPKIKAVGVLAVGVSIMSGASGNVSRTVLSSGGKVKWHWLPPLITQDRVWTTLNL